MLTPCRNTIIWTFPRHAGKPGTKSFRIHRSGRGTFSLTSRISLRTQHPNPVKTVNPLKALVEARKTNLGTSASLLQPDH
jgi:hypothetical protein